MTKCPKCDLQWEPPCDQTACIELFGECISCRRFKLTEDEIKQIQASVALERKAENARELGLDYEPLEEKDGPHKWKLVPIEPTDEMLKAMDECSIEGYDERLYAGYAASVYMAAVDVAPNPSQQHAEDMAKLGWQYFECPACGSEGARAFPKQEAKDEPVAWLHTKIEGVAVPHRPADLDKHPDRWEALYKTPPSCPTCKALSRTVMLDQTSHDTTSPQRTWVGLTDEEIEQGCKESWVTEQAFQSAVWWAEAKLKDKNT